ncbi:MAG: hypothetical protein LBC60_04290 [Spirochaetaceae bacterium]|nr:hypothetical protein [Spirochaetaceae bacterium]
MRTEAENMNRPLHGGPLRGRVPFDPRARFVIICSLLMALCPAAARPLDTAVMPFAGDDPAVSGRLRDAAITAMGSLPDLTPQSLDTPVSQPDAPPDSSLLAGTPYALTGEYYFDDEDMQHFQMWLWEGASGALVYTDELVAENLEEAEGYLPPLVTWVFSKIPALAEGAAVAAGAGTDGEAGEAAGTGTGAGGAGEAENGAGGAGTGGTGPRERRSFPKLYLGLGIGGALDSQSIRPTENYEGTTIMSFGGEAVLSVEFRPWRRLGFQAEGIVGLASFSPFQVETSGGSRVHTTDQYMTLFMRFPLLVKLLLDLDEFGLSLLGGPYYILSLWGNTYREKPTLPLGLMAGMDLTYPLGPGELFGGLRYGIDIGLSVVEGNALQYRRSRLVLSLGYRFLVIGR